MAWRRIGDKPLSEPVLTWSTNAYMRHQGEMSQTKTDHHAVSSTAHGVVEKYKVNALKKDQKVSVTIYPLK